jgi:hypothetical protein
MKRRRVVFQDFAVLDEGNISDAQLLCLPLLCFRNLRVFAQAHHPEMGAAASSPIAWQSSVDFEERMRRSMQTRKAFCCTSFGLSFLYDLS